jgi:integrase
MSIEIRKKKLANGKESLYLDIYKKGFKRKCMTLGIYLDQDRAKNKEKMEKAKQIRAAMELEMISEEHGLPSNVKSRANFIDYFQAQTDKVSHPGTRSTWQTALDYLKAYRGDNIEFRTIDESFIEGYISFLSRKVARNTAIGYYKKFKAALNKAVMEKILDANPCQNVKTPQKQDTKKVFLVKEDIEKLIEAKCKNEQVKLAFLFSCFTSLRFSDVKNLKWKNIDNDSICFKQQKTSTTEYIPLSETAMNILDGLPKDRKPEQNVFKLPTNCMANMAIKDWTKNAEISKHVTFHSSRHTFAVISLMANVPLYTVSQLMGHSSIKTTEIYADIVNEAKKKAVDALPKLKVFG